MKLCLGGNNYIGQPQLVSTNNYVGQPQSGSTNKYVGQPQSVSTKPLIVSPGIDPSSGLNDVMTGLNSDLLSSYSDRYGWGDNNRNRYNQNYNSRWWEMFYKYGLLFYYNDHSSGTGPR